MIKHYCDNCGKEIQTWEYKRVITTPAKERISITIENPGEDGEFQTAELCAPCFTTTAINSLNL